MPFASSLFATAASFEALRQSRRFFLMADGFAVCCFFLKLTTAAGSGRRLISSKPKYRGHHQNKNVKRKSARA
jgi:hypothetical protein